MSTIFPAVREHFPKDSRLELAIRPFLQGFDVTFTSISRYRKSDIETQFILLKPEISFKEGFGFEREILGIISKNEDFQARDIEIIDIIYNENKARVDPFVCVLFSECDEIESKLDILTYTDPDNICIIPISISWIIKNKPSLPEIRTIFQKYMYSRDLFAFESPIKKDISFFGRENTLLSFIDRFRSGQNSGLFGLRKIGKTSVLYAIARRIENKNIGGVLYFDCSNPSFYKSRWYECLQSLVLKMISENELNHLHNLHALSSTYNDNNAALFFEEDIKLISTERYSRFLIMLDEIEWISFNTSTEKHWSSDFLPFWQTMRSVHQNSNGSFCFIISGVNPKCIEEESIMGYDNPLFALIKPTFLQPFDVKTLREMVRKLGRYMGIKFDEDLYPMLYELYGGHPFLVRHACSKLCELNNERPITFNLSIFQENKKIINLSLLPYVKQILSILAIWYPKEFEHIVELSRGDFENVQKYIEQEPEYVDHLLGYGIVNIIDKTPKLSIFLMSDYLKKLPIKKDDPILEYVGNEQNIDAIYTEISLRRNNIERKLRSLLKQSLKLSYGNNCMNKLLGSIYDKEKMNQFSYDNVWEHLFFRDLISILDKNWDIFQKWFSRDKSDVMFWLKHINEFRIDAHAKSISNDDLVYLKVCFTRMEEKLTDID